MSSSWDYGRLAKLVGSTMLLGVLSGCGTMHQHYSDNNARTSDVVTVVEQAPGVVEYSWEEPMVDSVEVPAGLDAEGHYYRPSHRELREIRQGRWQRYSPD